MKQYEKYEKHKISPKRTQKNEAIEAVSREIAMMNDF